MPASESLSRQYGIRPSEDVVALLEEAAARLQTYPTTLATKLLEDAVRERLADGSLRPSDSAEGSSAEYETMWRMMFLVDLNLLQLDSQKYDARTLEETAAESQARAKAVLGARQTGDVQSTQNKPGGR